MKFYDLIKAQTIIENNLNGLEQAFLGIKEDMFFTEILIYDKDEGFLSVLGEHFNKTLQEVIETNDFVVSGIQGSDYGTPILKLVLQNENIKYECWDILSI